MKFGQISSSSLTPPFDRVQTPELAGPPNGIDSSRVVQTTAPFFDLSTQTTRFYVMYHGLDSLEPPPPITKGGLAPWQLRRVKNALSSNVRQNVPLIALAQMCGLSKSHFLREFKQSTGYTPHQWAIFHSVSVAAELLRDTNLSVTQVAVAGGFADVSHLSRWFKRVTGVSPKAWQRNGSKVRQTTASQKI